ncbi:MAG TPA: exodeoxyribonuclease VII large subunit [Verrucomicrobiae bacterium]|nr:exodeoxyribonuclease VII large subunit [Verrucomicrobiae bacterium]
MGKRAKSQWEFGELFPAEAVRKTLTVSELTGSIRRVLEKEIGSISVLGEITNLRIQSSGHIYFTIKDASAQLACVLFRNESRAINREYLTDGQKVILDGALTVYEARGQYQLQVFSVQLQGLGALQAAFARLKEKLQAEGLFDQSHKRPLPPCPERIGLITSPVGAAIRDVLHSFARRNPSLEITFVPCRVQGPGAGQEIAAAIHLLNDWAFSAPKPRLDLILLTRGGGSLEDLWAFNEEILARAIYTSRLPVLSAVGHEIDFSISDFVADFRAATPTAGAEIITEGFFAARSFVAAARRRLWNLLEFAFNQRLEKTRILQRRLLRMHPQRRLAEQAQRVDDAQVSINRCGRHHLRQKQAAFQTLRLRLLRSRPDALIARRRERLLQLRDHLEAASTQKLQALRGRLARAEARLKLLSAENVLNRGYSITIHAETGQVLRDSSEVEPGAKIKSRLARGEITSVVNP